MTNHPIAEQDSLELKPCPFCGSAPHFTPRQGSFAAYVACINESCGVQPESGSMDPAYAKARWNTRPEADTLSQMRDALEAVRPLVEAARGLSFGTDWNNGTQAKAHGYRRKLLKALPRAIAALTTTTEKE